MAGIGYGGRVGGLGGLGTAQRKRDKEKENQENRRKSEAYLAGSVGSSMSRRDNILKMEGLTA